MSTDKVSLVLSSGGARGLAHLGVIESLVNDQIEISEISGSSIGSVIAVFYASDELNVFKDWIFNLDKMGVFSYMDFSVSGQGLLKGDKVFNQLKKILPNHIKTFPINKIEITEAILNEEKNLKKIVKVVHLEIRKKMSIFIKKNKNKKIIYEVYLSISKRALKSFL